MELITDGKIQCLLKHIALLTIVNRLKWLLSPTKFLFYVFVFISVLTVLKHNKWLFLFHRLYNSSKKFRLCDLCLLNVVVPSESKSTVATCNWTRAITQIQTTCDGVNGGTLPCVWLAHATSGDSVTKQPHLSPQHHELNGRQHALDRTRVSVSKRCSKAMEKNNKLGGSRCADLTAPHRSDPLFIMQEYMTNLFSKGREGKLNDRFTISNSYVA